jgi:hypothetical protein
MKAVKKSSKCPSGPVFIMAPRRPDPETAQFEERRTGGFIFENEWQSFRTRQNRGSSATTQ